MATVINNRSTLVTDPLRNFRFLVEMFPHNGGVDSTQRGSTTPAVSGSNRLPVMGFTSVSGLAVTTDSIPYREGGYNTTVHQIPGQTTFSPVTLQRGVILGSRHNWDWMRKLFRTVQAGSNGQIGTDITNNFRYDVEIQVLSHPIAESGTSANPTDPYASANNDHIAMRFKIYNAWITSVAYSDLTAGDNALMVEQMTLVHEGFDVNWAENLTTSAPEFN
jgi:phage tail-like protein